MIETHHTPRLEKISGKLPDDDKPDFSLGRMAAIEKTMVDELELERFVLDTGQ